MVALRKGYYNGFASSLQIFGEGLVGDLAAVDGEGDEENGFILRP